LKLADAVTLKIFKTSKIEDEFNFILNCPLYNDLRKKLLKKNIITINLVYLSSTSNISNSLKLGKFLNTATPLRKSKLDV
jgi:hypothetical protein